VPGAAAPTAATTSAAASSTTASRLLPKVTGSTLTSNQATGGAAGSSGRTGQGIGGGVYFASGGVVCLDLFTSMNIIGNTASISEISFKSVARFRAEIRLGNGGTWREVLQKVRFAMNEFCASRKDLTHTTKSELAGAGLPPSKFRTGPGIAPALGLRAGR
jgi:hypothetical protein